MSNRIYLDWAATALPDKSILEIQYKTALSTFGNPSSSHSYGREASSLLKKSRERILSAMGCKQGKFIFTSGGTESNQLILLSLIKKPEPGHIIVSSIEHPSVFEPIHLLKELGWNISFISPDTEGKIQPRDIEDRIGNKTRLIAIMGLNNETGSIQDLKAINAIIRSKEREIGRSIHFHSDLVQALGKISVKPEEWGLDSASFSGHKIGAPRGIGGLYLRKDLDVLLKGGGQEDHMRPGTENLPAIASFAEAFDKYILPDQKVYSLGESLVSGLKSIKGLKIISGDSSIFYPGIVSCALPPVPGEVLVRIMDQNGFCISTGSACSSNKKQKTRIIESYGIPKDIAFSSIRISIGNTTQKKDIDLFIEALSREYYKLKNMLH